MTNAKLEARVRRIPRVEGLPLVGALPSVVLGQLAFFERSFADKGGIFELDLGVTTLVVVGDPELAEAVLVHQFRNFDKGEEFWEGSREYLGLGLPLSDGELWRRQRRLMQPEFQRQLVESHRATIDETIARALDELPTDNACIDVARWCDDLLALLTVRILLGSNLDRSRTEEIHRALSELVHGVLPGMVLRKLPRWLPRPRRQHVERAQRVVDDIVLTLIAERRRRPDGSHDLLGTLIRATDESGTMSDRQLRDEVVTLYLGGYETTGMALAWMLWLLARHPEVRSRLQAELDAEPERAPLRRACIHESLRLYPPAVLIPRRAVNDVVLGGFLVPADTTVIVSPWIIHHDPGLWPCPHTFEPERFMGTQAARGRPRLSWMPFGAGQRICIGKALAMLQLERAITLILRRFTPMPAIDRPAPEPRLSATLKSSKGIHLSFLPRSTRPAGPSDASA